jgi:hypothetical protein
MPDDRVAAMYDPNNPNGGRGRGNFGGRGGRGGAEPGRMTAQQVADAVDSWLINDGAVLRMNDAARGEGIIVAQQHRAYRSCRTFEELASMGREEQGNQNPAPKGSLDIAPP